LLIEDLVAFTMQTLALSLHRIRKPGIAHLTVPWSYFGSA
jgi:hypothetical protein